MTVIVVGLVSLLQSGLLADLYRIDLIPTPDLVDVRATATLRWSDSPFSVAVTQSGAFKYGVSVTIDGLPPPETLGPYTVYVAWAVTPVLDPVVKLGEVDNGSHRLGEVEFNKFLILVTAEATASVSERSGRLVLRGRSPSSLMESHDLSASAPSAVIPAQSHEHTHGTYTWETPPMPETMSMLPGLHGLEPAVSPYLPPGADEIPEARPRTVARLADGDTLHLDASMVKRTVRGRRLLMFGFNDQYPGPLLDVTEQATVVVVFQNNTDWPSSIHWHGLRLENRFDGAPGVTQKPVPPGGEFVYRVYFPDPGIYWYHPHHREDILQDLGLYGNMIVRASDPDYYNSVHREEVIILDDLLLGDTGPAPYGSESATHVLMGRFGNIFLANGEPELQLEARDGEVVRFFLTNVSNTRTFNLSFGDLSIKVIGSDVSKFEREVWASSIVIAPAERYIVEVMFSGPGLTAAVNAVQAVDHRRARFVTETDTLFLVDVAAEPASPNLSDSFDRLRKHDDVAADLDAFRAHFNRPPDRELVLALEVDDMPPAVEQLMRLDAVYANPVEWSGTMPVMNWISTGREVSWILRDPESGRENMEIDWQFAVGDVVKIRLRNEREVFHAMQHPVHLHGQRFLVLSMNGEPNTNLVWKDTVLLPAGAEADILLDATNPGNWMLHCHIAEHLDSGMKMVFSVQEE